MKEGDKPEIIPFTKHMHFIIRNSLSNMLDEYSFDFSMSIWIGIGIGIRIDSGIYIVYHRFQFLAMKMSQYYQQ